MRYLFLLYGPDGPLPAPGSPEGQQMISEWRAATDAMARAGVLIDCAPLQPPSAATTVQVRGGETLLTDGPAAEIKEQFGGYTLVDCADLDEALRWAATVPTAFSGSVEVRPVVQIPDSAAEVPG
ncbi:MAG TPA: YciI family protein [Streptosporangiaceae bacterium]|nr:YciI family protein [Streptosporangiaceae bacterium]